VLDVSKRYNHGALIACRLAARGPIHYCCAHCCCFGPFYCS
jgi:hypothetical protein